jgi:hypothetical protein
VESLILLHNLSLFLNPWRNVKEEKEQYGCDVAYCVTCILREFKTPKPKAILFRYPLHTLAPDIDPKRTGW